MAELLSPENLCEGISKLLSVNSVFTDKDLKITVVANKYAGGFTRKKESEKNKKLLDAVLKKADGKTTVAKSCESEVITTECCGHAVKIASETAEKAKSEKNVLRVIVTAGGDGTSLEVQTGLTKWAQESEENRKVVFENIVVFRLPLGTGNDGTDGHVFEESLDMLEQPLHFANARAIKFSLNGEVTEDGIKEAGKNPAAYGNAEDKAPWYAFNVAGIGLDAFVCWKTNEEKAKHPGNHYQLMVDFATLNYNKAFPPEPAVTEFYNGSELIGKIESAFEMMTFGVSGHRTFGGGKKVFPVEENAAFVRKLDVLTMVAKNGKFTDGSYVETNLASTFNATKVVLNYDKPVLCELDGETHLLLKENFPITMELTEPLIQVLERDDLSWSRGTERK